MVRAGGRAVRIAPWPADERTAQLTVVAGGAAPSRAVLETVLADVAREGYVAVVTAALGPSERPPFTDAGFQPLAWLTLLDHDLRDLPLPAPSRPELRRARRSDWPTVADLDARAFPTFWHLGPDGIDEARHATPSNRVRLAIRPGGGIGGYAIFGRSGDRGFLQRLAVDPGVQGQGLATTLVLDGLRWLRSRGATSALVNTQTDNERALALYTRLGFQLQIERLAVLGRRLGGTA
jgi:ribosomal protein S18 acetylase RimI-like enzyme